MPLKILHTTDWHIGQTFYDYDRSFEHQQFFNFLVDKVKELDVDVLLMSGDVFDVANPSAQAQNMFYHFLRDVSKTQPQLQIVIIAGNHDSAGRLEAPSPLLKEFNITIIGQVQRKIDRSIDLDKLIIPLVNRKGERKAWCMAIPFLRQGDYPYVPEARNSYTEGVVAFYQQTYQHALGKSEEGEAIVAMGHLHAMDARVSQNDRSERPIIGGVEFIPVTAFDDSIAYTALGHIHRAQRVGGREHVRYAGSPLPMSFSETNYRHQLIYVEFKGEKATVIESVEIPKTVELVRLPGQPKPLEDVLPELAALPLKDEELFNTAPYLEVRILLNEPQPSLKYVIETTLKDKHVRLARIDVNYPGATDQTVPNARTFDDLQTLQPLDILSKAYQSKYNSSLPTELVELFKEVVQEVNINQAQG